MPRLSSTSEEAHTMSTEKARITTGLEMMDAVYGPGFSASMGEPEDAFMEETVGRLFGEVWNRPGLSIRDRRLIVMGATTAMGRADLLEVQVRGALVNEELTESELYEAALHLMYYVGVGNAGALHRATVRALDDPRPAT
jgi:4-carboxymuconolactone decarboxylase